MNGICGRFMVSVNTDQNMSFRELLDRDSRTSTSTPQLGRADGFSRRAILRRSATISGAITVGTVASSTRSQARFPIPNGCGCGGCCDCLCPCDCGFTCGCNIDENGSLKRGDRNAIITGHVLGPEDVPVTIEIELEQGDVHAVGRRTVRCTGRKLDEDGPLDPDTATSWTVQVNTRGSGRLTAEPARVRGSGTFRHAEVKNFEWEWREISLNQ